jgi:hypothetical protein
MGYEVVVEEPPRGMVEVVISANRLGCLLLVLLLLLLVLGIHAAHHAARRACSILLLSHKRCDKVCKVEAVSG